MYILNYTGDGGTEKYVLELISALGKEKCILVYSEKGPAYDNFLKLGIPIYQVKMRHPFDLRAASQIKNIVRKERVKIIHAQFLRENYISLIASFIGAKVNVIWTYHVNVPMPSYVKFFNRIMTRNNYKIIAVAEFMKKELLKKGVPKNKVTVIYNGIKVPNTNEKVNNRNKIIISVIGRLSKEKGHSFLLLSLAKLRESHPNLRWKLNIVGDGPLYEELLTLSNTLELKSYINFKGYVENVSSIYFNSDIIVIPSENEAFPFVAIEALAYEKPVISTNVGGLPEIIRHNQTGLLLNYGDINSLSENIQKLTTNNELSNKLAKNGKDFFLRKLTLDKMLEKTFSVYGLTSEEIKKINRSLKE